MIKEHEVDAFQNAWAAGIIAISKAFEKNENYIELAEKFVDDFYDYDSEKVLFKPTMASDHPFRYTKIGALSYFIGGNPDYSEDTGFAIKDHIAIKFDNHNVVCYEDIALAMGEYYFHFADHPDKKVEYSMAMRRVADHKLKLFLHHSSFPFIP